MTADAVLAFQPAQAVASEGAARTHRFCTGFGQSDTHAVILRDGRRNPHKSAGTDYATITAPDIVRIVRTPPSCAKDEAQWFIPSTYAESDARSHEAQRTHGTYWWLTLDIDKRSPSLEQVRAALESVIGSASYLVYSSRGAAANVLKWRALVPLRMPVEGVDFEDTQNAFFDLLEESGGGAIECDRPLARPGQLVYLPNRGEFYDCHIQQSERLNLDADHAIIRRREYLRQAKADAEREVRAARLKKRVSHPVSAGVELSPVEHFNSAHTVADLLSRYGYEQDGRSDDWRSTYQSSSSFATRDYGDYWISLSGSDDAAGLGSPTQNGYRHGDPFDLFAHFEHRGDFGAAVRAYANEAGLHTPLRSETFRIGSPDTDNQEHPAQKQSADTFDLSHDALASDLGLRSWDDNARHVAMWGKWLFWNGMCWEKDDCLGNLTKVRSYLRLRAAELIEWAEQRAQVIEAGGEESGEKVRKWAAEQARNLRSKNTVAAVDTLARSNPKSVASPEDFDTARMLLGTPGGTVDLRTGELRDAARNDRITRLAAVAPAEPGASPQLWLKFLNDVFGGDQETIAFLQRAAGYALTGSTSEHKLLFLYGTGRNGKSVFLNVLFDLLGDYARRASAGMFLNSQTERHPTDLAGLQGARLVIGSELPKGKTWDESIIKDLTGGDRMTARFMRGDFFDFDPQLTLMIAGNNQPSFRGVDEAIRARVVLVPFTVTIPPEKRDKDLPEKLRAEYPDILRWAIDGALEWQRRGLDVPQSIAAASTQYFDDEDTVGQFLEDACAVETGAFVSGDMLHQRFAEWSERQGLNGWTKRTVIKEVRLRGFADAKSNGVRGLKGLRLK